MSYRFPLQRVLDVKEKEKQQAQQELGSSLKKQQDTEEQMFLLSQKRERVQASMLQPNKGCKASQLHEHQRYISFLDQQMLQLKTHLQQTKIEVEQKQGILIEKSKEERVWQSWKQELFVRYQQEASKQEQEMLDEMASIRYFRQQMEWE